MKHATDHQLILLSASHLQSWGHTAANRTCLCRVRLPSSGRPPTWPLLPPQIHSSLRLVTHLLCTFGLQLSRYALRRRLIGIEVGLEFNFCSRRAWGTILAKRSMGSIFKKDALLILFYCSLILFLLINTTHYFSKNTWFILKLIYWIHLLKFYYNF